MLVSEGAGLLKADKGIFICMELLLVGGVYTPEVVTVAKVVLVACATGWAVETACTARVVPIEQPTLAGEFLWMPELGKDGLLFGFAELAGDRASGALVRLPTLDWLCTGINSTLPDCWLVTKVPVWPCRSWGCEDIATGTCNITGNDCSETDIGCVFPPGTWLGPTTVAVLAAGIMDVVKVAGVKGVEVTGVCGLGCPLFGVWVAVTEADTTKKKWKRTVLKFYTKLTIPIKWHEIRPSGIKLLLWHGNTYIYCHKIWYVMPKS